MTKPLLVYVVGRFAIFAVLLLVLWLVGLGGLLGAAVALVLSVPLSYLLLRRQREEVTAALQRRSQAKAEFRSRLRGS